MTSVDSWDECWRQFVSILESAKEFSSDVVLLPENSLYMRLNRSDKVQAREIHDEMFSRLGRLAKDRNTHILLGSVPLVLDGRIYNSTVWATPQGQISAPYQKMHLFDIKLEGQDPISESADFAHGAQPKVIEVNGWKFGLSICYDLRFPDLFSVYSRQHVDVITVPSAFLVKTGEAHWHTLLRARAIESQCYVLAPAQSGSHNGLRDTYGHSLVVDPWGRVLVDGRVENGIFHATLEADEVTKVRKQIPMKDHRRL